MAQFNQGVNGAFSGKLEVLSVVTGVISTT